MKITVKRQTTAGEFRAQVDNKELHFDSSGTEVMVVGDGQHDLTWQVLGNPGDTWSIAITDPPGLCSSEGTLDDSDHDEGSCEFFI